MGASHAVSRGPGGSAQQKGDLDLIGMFKTGIKSTGSKRHQSPLYAAVELGDLEVVHELLQAGARVNQGNGEETPLHRACADGRADLCCLLLNQGAFVLIDLSDVTGRTPLWRALLAGHVGVMKVLLDSGADPNVVWVKEGKCERALIRAVKMAAPEMIHLLLQHGAERSINQKDDSGQTALHLATSLSNTEIVTHLLAVPHVDVDVQDPEGRTPLYIASSKGYTNIVILLLKAGCDPNIPVKTHQWSGGRHTPLHQAAKTDDRLIAEKLLAHNANVDAQDSHKRTPLSYACEAGHVNVARRLLGGRCDADIPDLNGNTPLIYATKGRHVDLARDLAIAGADLNTCGTSGRSALHLAAEKGYLDIIWMLLIGGANYFLQDKYGSTALESSISSRCRETNQCVFFLLLHGHPLPSDITPLLGMLRTKQKRDLLRLFIELGWTPTLIGRQRLTVLLSQLYNEDDDLVTWLQTQVFSPMSLTRMCRNAVRMKMALAIGYTSILPLINKLNLPDDIKSVLLLNDIKDTYINSEYDETISS